MATQIPVVMEWDSIDPTNANAFWTVLSGSQYNQGVYRFAKSGDAPPMAMRGQMSFKAPIPGNLASPANWNLVLRHQNASGSAGAILLRVEAIVLASGDTPSAMTTIVPNQLIGVDASGDHNITTLSESSFDSLVTLTAGRTLRVLMSRIPYKDSGDTLLSHWDMEMPPTMLVDVT